MAEALGINTRDRRSGGLRARHRRRGSGGLGLALIAPVTPTVGQSYIVYAFLVVIVGGLGSLPGTSRRRC